MVRSRFFAWLVFVVAISPTAALRAELLMEPLGVVLLDGNQGSEAAVAINPSSTFGGLFYGNPVGAIHVAEDGHIYFDQPTQFPMFPTGLNDAEVALIAPLWDDFLMLPGAALPPSAPTNQVINHSVPGQYIGVTWQNVRLFNETVATTPTTPGLFPSTSRSFQVLWFEAPTTIRGVPFQANEIVFSYVAHQPGTSNFGPLFATIGIADGSGRFTPLPQDGDGYIESLSGGLNANDPSRQLAWEPGSFLRFRPELQGGAVQYVATKEFVTAVPEPSLVAFGCAALAAFGFNNARKRHRRRFTHGR
jgi:hypothetical protein